MDNLSAIGQIASSALRAQSERLRLISENMANAESTGDTPGADPYRRKVPVFEQLTNANGANTVAVSEVIEDQSPFQMSYNPNHPAADANGYVKKPNVNPLIELANMREASRSYEASLNILENGKQMRNQLIGLLS